MYTLSKQALMTVVPIIGGPSCKDDRPQFNEDHGMAVCLQSVGITAEETYDEEGKEMTMVGRIGYHQMMSRDPPYWFHINPNHDNPGLGEDCCSFYPIATHNHKLPHSLREYEEAFYGGGTFEPYMHAMEKRYIRTFRSIHNEVPAAYMQFAEDRTCVGRCHHDFHGCTADLASWSHPSCPMGCAIADGVSSLERCRAACRQIDGKCDWSLGEVDGVVNELKGNNCGSCPEDIERGAEGDKECLDGCAFAFTSRSGTDDTRNLSDNGR